MSVVVDTPIWSLLFRRDVVRPNPESQTLKELVATNQAEIIGAVRQEILSGVKHQTQFERLRDDLRLFQDFPAHTDHFEQAAEFFNTCRSQGIQGSGTDFLICAVAHLEDWSIFTTDGDFEHFARIIPIRLYRP
jgi:hypothetical protein